ncbi:hypothetical protein LC609_37340 [Nostoc sp. XA013]|nr:hypothetical protein [Nostoc sp. XA013]
MGISKWGLILYLFQNENCWSNTSLQQLVEQAQTLIADIAVHPNYKQLLNEGYQPDLNIADASTALTYLQWELDHNQEPSN